MHRLPGRLPQYQHHRHNPPHTHRRSIHMQPVVSRAVQPQQMAFYVRAVRAILVWKLAGKRQQRPSTVAPAPRPVSRSNQLRWFGIISAAAAEAYLQQLQWTLYSEAVAKTTAPNTGHGPACRTHANGAGTLPHGFPFCRCSRQRHTGGGGFVQGGEEAQLGILFCLAHLLAELLHPKAASSRLLLLLLLEHSCARRLRSGRRLFLLILLILGLGVFHCICNGQIGEDSSDELEWWTTMAKLECSPKQISLSAPGAEGGSRSDGLGRGWSM